MAWEDSFGPPTYAKAPVQDLPVGKPSAFSVPMTVTPSTPQPEGMVAPGNIDLQMQPRTHNPDGSTSSVRSSSFADDNGNEVLVPTVSPGGMLLSDKQAWDQYNKTGKHLGKFKTPDHADSYAETLHNDYANGKIAGYPEPTAGLYPNKSDAGQKLNIARQGINRGFYAK